MVSTKNINFKDKSIEITQVTKACEIEEIGYRMKSAVKHYFNVGWKIFKVISSDSTEYTLGLDKNNTAAILVGIHNGKAPDEIVKKVQEWCKLNKIDITYMSQYSCILTEAQSKAYFEITEKIHERDDILNKTSNLVVEFIINATTELTVENYINHLKQENEAF